MTDFKECHLEFRTAAIVSCWISVAVIASVYMIVFASKVGDVLFGVFLPVGLLVLIALVVTIYAASSSGQDKTAKS